MAQLALPTSSQSPILVLSSSVIHPPSLWPEAELENWKAAAAISNPIASVDKCFMKAFSLLVLVGRDVSTAARDVNAFFMLHLRYVPATLARAHLAPRERGQLA
jgi:hypothetical protein